MLLAVDIGNTRIKCAVFEQDTTIESFSFAPDTLQSNIDAILEKFPKCTDLIVASVGNLGYEAFSVFENRFNLHFVSCESKLPFENLYATPHTLGTDRIVLAAGAVLQFPQQNRLVIDAGTCITYDFINNKDQYLGGGISPGIRLRYEALHRYTAKLPLLNRTLPDSYVGNNTDQSIHSGVIQGLLHEIDGFMTQYQAEYPKIIIILTGGDAEFLANQLKNTIFANSNFLLESLNRTFQYKIKND